jgi:hypothetical protein
MLERRVERTGWKQYRKRDKAERARWGKGQGERARRKRARWKKSNVKRKGNARER